MDNYTEIENLRNEIAPYLRNQFVGQASGDMPIIEDGAEGTQLRTALLKGKTTVIIGEDSKSDTLFPSAPNDFIIEKVLSAEGETETVISYDLPDGLQLYSTPNNEYQDSYNILSGTLTKACKIHYLREGWIFNYLPEADTITWITNPLYVPNKSYYFMFEGKISATQKTDWQGKISIGLQKVDLGITSEDTAAQAAQKARTYFGDSYAVLPLKTPERTPFTSLQIPLPNGKIAFHAEKCDTQISYCRDMNAVYNELARKN